MLKAVKMRYKVVVLKSFTENLDKIAEWFRENVGAYSAKNFEIKVWNALKILETNPKLYNLYPYSDKGYRRLVVGNYLVFYIVYDETATVKVHQILHGSADIQKHLNAPYKNDDELLRSL